MKVLFPVLPKGVSGVACDLGLDEDGWGKSRGARGKPVFVLRDALMVAGLRDQASMQGLAERLLSYWYREFGPPLWVGGYTVVSRDEAESGCWDGDE